MTATDPVSAFIDAACVPLDSGHASGTLERAEAILAAHPDISSRSIHTAAILGDADEVRRFVDNDASSATNKGGPREWDPLTHLCFSRYLRLSPARSAGFVRAATTLLDAGASANTGWMEHNHQPERVWESALYGAAGVAHHAELTKLLLSRGADPNDEETPYHAPETYDNAALKILVDSGKLTAASLSTILLRKTDWHDHDGIKWLLERGVQPDFDTRWGKTALHNAVLSDNSLAIVELLLDLGPDPLAVASRPERGSPRSGRRTAVEMAARRGRSDLLDAFAKRVTIDLQGLERLLAVCARGDAEAVRIAGGAEPQALGELRSSGGRHLAWFAGNDNVE